MGISKEEYFFMEWLILDKGISQEQFEGMERLTEITVDLKEHPAGIYLLMVEQDEQRKFVRIIKQ